MATEEMWRAVVIIEKDQSKEIDPTVRRLRNLGIENIHLVVAPSVRVSKAYDHISHQADEAEWGDSYSLFRGGIDLISNVYASRSELFLVIRPHVSVWGQLLTYCEYTIPRDKVAVWCPLNPDRLFPTSRPTKADCGPENFGWCPHPVSRDMSSSDCFVMSGHVLTLMASYLPPLEDGAAVASMIAEHLGRRNVPFYFHTPSLATSAEFGLAAEDFVGVPYHLNQKDMTDYEFVLEDSAA